MHRHNVQKKMKEMYDLDNFTIRNKCTECFFDNSLQFSYEDDDTLEDEQSA